MADLIKEPPHYTQHKIEPKDLMKAKQYIDFIINKQLKKTK